MNLQEKLSELTANVDNYVTEKNGILTLYHEHQLDKTYVLTPRAYKVPVRIEAVARTDSSNIRLKYAMGQLIFNWERNHDSLRCVEPAKGKAHHNMNGRVPIHEWNHLVWEIEPDFMRVTVNGSERLYVEGNFTKVIGQAGIGSAFRSTVAVRSFCVAGEETDPPPAPPKPLMFEYDETHICVPEGALDTAAQWYAEHLGLEPKPGFGPCKLHPSMKGILMQFPNGYGSLHLISVSEDRGHFEVNKDSIDQFRMQLKAKNIHVAYAYAKAKGIQTSSLYEDGRGTWFHLYDPYGNQLTVTQGEDADVETEGSGIYGCDLPAVAVSDLESAVEWYSKALGMRKNGRKSGDGYAWMKGFYRHNGVRVNVLQLVQEPDCSNPDASKPGIRQYFYVERHNLKKAYRKAQRWSTRISPLEDRLFHFYDPDGNRINVYS